MMNPSAGKRFAFLTALLLVLLSIVGVGCEVAESDDDQTPEQIDVDPSVDSVDVLARRPPRVVVPPTFDPPSGSYASTIRVRIDTVTPRATIHFTTDGSTPTESSPIYRRPIVVTPGMTTIQAIATRNRWLPSPVSVAVYQVGLPPSQVSPVTFLPPSGTFPSPIDVTLVTATAGATIHYTLDGSDPTTSSPAYSLPIHVVGPNATLKAFAVKSGSLPSVVTVGSYSILPPPLPVVIPVAFNPPSGSYAAPIDVSMSTPTTGAVIHYTLDGSDPTFTSPVYVSPLHVDTTTTIKAFAEAPGYLPSAVTVMTYDIVVPPSIVAPVVFHPMSGVYASPIDVILVTSTPGATIHYTLDGTDPTTLSPMYSLPIHVDASTTLKAFAVKAGSMPSLVSVAVYEITPP